jgi:hypothetical protein
MYGLMWEPCERVSKMRAGVPEVERKVGICGAEAGNEKVLLCK